MTAPMQSCANCGQKFKDGHFRSNQPLKAGRLAVLNEFSSGKLDGACDMCGAPAYDKALKTLNSEVLDLDSAVARDCALIPIVSINSPSCWNYQSIGIVTAQSVTGTGIFSDVTSTVTDLVGSQSNTYIDKIARGEMMCCSILRMKALALECNAILAADVDYAEVGGARAMLMVCMTGTAVRLQNIDILGQDMERALNRLRASYERSQKLKTLRATAETEYD